MNYKRITLACIVVFMTIGLGGCSTKRTEGEQHQVESETESSLAKPEIIGKTPDGQTVYRAHITNVPYGYHDHWVYWIGQTVTVNHEETAGKTTTNQVEVTINGKSMTMLEAQTQITKMAQEKQTAELKQLRELEAKYGAQGAK